MPIKMVGVREFKAKLSAYLGEVKSGKTIVITDRGKPVGRIIPIAKPLEDRLAELAKHGNYKWSGKKLKSGKPLKVKVRGKKMISEIVSENRD
jgi:prevent-host-death family protein